MDDVLDAGGLILSAPPAQERRKRLANRNLPYGIPRALGGIGHSDDAPLQIDIPQQKTEEIGRTYARPAVGADDNHLTR